MNKLWGGRFTVGTAEEVEEFSASIAVDYQLAEDDIFGSLAHAKMLGKCQILAEAEVTALTQGLKKVAGKIAAGAVKFRVSDEDIHMNIERFLTDEIGAVAGKLHTARSRNDQVALDLRLYLRKHVIACVEQLQLVQQALLAQAKLHSETIMPGYTHLQRAQPILFAHHLLAYVAMLQRDIVRFQQSWQRINQLPLGAGALAGTSFAIDRHYLAELLGFDGVCENSLDAVSDRDFIIEFLANAALLFMHLSRFSEELILWSSQEFAFVELADAYCTGSSMMPQKKNPDVPELMRGKTGRVYGALFNLLTIMKGLPLAYNKDLQEDKEPLFDTVKTLQRVLTILPSLLSTMKVNTENMLQATKTGFLNATDLADYLVQKGLPFRDAHSVVGKLVSHCIEHQLGLEQLALATLREFSPLFSQDVFAVLEIPNIIAARDAVGGTSYSQVQQQMGQVEKNLENTGVWLMEKEQLLAEMVGRFE